MIRTSVAVLLLSAAAAPSVLQAQDDPDARVDRIVFRPDSVVLSVGEQRPLEVVALDADGNPIPDADLTASVQSAEITYDRVNGIVTGVSIGRSRISARVRRQASGPIGFDDVRAAATVVVEPARVDAVAVQELPDLYAGAVYRPEATATAAGEPRPDAPLRWAGGDPSVAVASATGEILARGPGSTELTVSSGSATSTVPITVVANPVARLDGTTALNGRVGDPLPLVVRAADADDRTVADVPVEWSWTGSPGAASDALLIERVGPASARVVANDPGAYRITATVGAARRDISFEAGPRSGRRPIRRIAHGNVPTGQSTTDLWVFEGQDGRDYVYTGTYSGNLLYAWDVTDAASPTITDSVRIDGRRVNDVKVNADRSLAVITSEHAADRRNGITVVDITDPAHPVKVSHYAEGLSGGVHNTWIEGDLVYAIHYGTRALHIIDISDPETPAEVGRWQLPNEDRFLHDVMVEDGLAYLSYWDDGVVILDVGAGITGGTPTEPRLVSQYAYRFEVGPEVYGNTHHAIRYGDYVFAGDEIFGCAECLNGPRGYIHVIDVSDIENPREVAFYKVPEAGSHNMWAEDDKLHIGYYQAGLRVVDISGELMGDLYRQGREIGWFMTEDATGTQPFATNTWGAQPYKGKIFASDGASGLWVVEMAEPADLFP
ncbi:MAG TPA: hypothetical protein VK837_05925 [Longimicrobiales bacterium]|nr:hypothetical protein [Longimicrobiales bacterium]